MTHFESPPAQPAVFWREIPGLYFRLVAAVLLAVTAMAVNVWPHALRLLGNTAQPGEAMLQPNDWPHWRGPARNDVSSETGLLKQWPAEGPKLLWLNKEVGLGYSAPAIAGGRLFTAGGLGKKEYLLCLDAATGEQRWSTAIGELYTNDMGGGPRGTPTIAGDCVYMLSGRGHLICAKAATGRLLWQTSLLELGTRVPRWGFGESVLVDGDQVVCTPGGDGGVMAAFDRATGKLRWRSQELTDLAQFSSIVPMVIDGQRQYVQVTKVRVFGIAAQTGAVRWQEDFPGRTVIPTPVVRAPYVYVSGGDGSGCLCVKIGPGSQLEKVYQNKVMKNHHGGVVLLGDYVYGHSDPVGWTCQNFLTGQQVWSERNRLGKGSVTCAEGLLYCVDELSGQVVLAEASPEGWREYGRFKLDPPSTKRSPQGRIWTHPVVAHGRLYLRDQELQFCSDVAAK